MKTAIGTLKRRAGRQAFTLIEMLMVLGLIAVFFFAIAIPVFANRDKDKGVMRQAVLDIQTGLKNTRSHAILNQAPMDFVIAAESGAMSVQKASNRGTIEPPLGQAERQVSSWGDFDFKATLPDATVVGLDLMEVNFISVMDASEVRVRFYPNGTCDEFQMIMRSSIGDIRRISLEVTTGLVSVERLR